MIRGQVVEALREAARLVGMGPDTDALRAIQTAQDALDAAKAAHLAGLEQSRGFEADGASSVTSLVRSRLLVSAPEAHALTRAGSTLVQLPRVAEAAQVGAIRLEHVNVFSYGLRHIGTRVVTDAQDWLLQVAQTCEPAELRRVMRALRAATYPGELDDAWAKGMDKADLQVNAVPEGFHVTGFLPIQVGSRFRTVLDSLSAPVDADDQRTGPERRVDAIDQLCQQILDAGLPSDKGVRPHVSVTADAETVHAAATHTRGTTSDPMVSADLAGFGPIGPELLSMIGCTADVTPILTHQMPNFSQSRVLNVGRTHRLATLKQRRAVLARQEGRCAAPGCRNTHPEIHHVVWWSRGGPTDLDNLVGLCSRCHH
ncbi:MAG: DUF222 domain-containing protein, partial [Aeromicrobium sp.]